MPHFYPRHAAGIPAVRYAHIPDDSGSGREIQRAADLDDGAERIFKLPDTRPPGPAAEREYAGSRMSSFAVSDWLAKARSEWRPRRIFRTSVPGGWLGAFRS